MFGGAMIDDIVGSRWEFRRIKTKASPLFSELNVITDDSILSMAVTDAIGSGGGTFSNSRAFAN
jgi:hypothetical protein